MATHDQGERFELVRSTLAASEARGHVLRYRDRLGEDNWQRARLLVSELATNAVRHGEGRIELWIARTPTGLRFTICDEGRHRPAPRTAGDDGGFGLHLVDELADRWGLGTGTTTVWFDVDIRKVA